VRVLLCLAMLLASQPVQAGMFDAPLANYYGPMQKGVGYKHSTTKDGYWKIEAESRRIDGSDFATDSALYRAAEMARAGGYRFVEMHDGYATRSRLGESVTVFALPTNSAIHPVRCRSGKPNRCYTADVSAVMKVLSGASGNQPGVAAPHHIDEFGRAVTISGFGTGAIQP
jgi:hypothetical protein